MRRHFGTGSNGRWSFALIVMLVTLLAMSAWKCQPTINTVEADNSSAFAATGSDHERNHRSGVKGVRSGDGAELGSSSHRHDILSKPDGRTTGSPDVAPWTAPKSFGATHCGHGHRHSPTVATVGLQVAPRNLLLPGTPGKHFAVSAGCDVCSSASPFASRTPSDGNRKTRPRSGSLILVDLCVLRV